MFEDLIGNEHNKELLKETIKTHNTSHSYIFSGEQGIGKRLFARQFAKNIMCLKDGTCHDKCDSCIKFNANSNTDFTEIEPEGKTLKIDQIRKMQEKIAEKPVISNKKIYVINNADLMSEESQNCLLKTLEEPPEYAIIILIVSNENKILPTIKSRCVSIRFNRISNQELKKQLPNLTDEQIKILNGSFQNIDFIEQRYDEYKKVLKIVDTLKNGSLLELIENSEILYTNKDSVLDILNYLNIILLEKQLIEPIMIVEKTKEKIILNNNYEMSIDYLLINSWKSIHKQGVQ